jgi:hypothetical protein
MPQHLWCEVRQIRLCEVCHAIQTTVDGGWSPRVSPICSGDDDSDGGGRRRTTRPRPVAPPGVPRVLEPA